MVKMLNCCRQQRQSAVANQGNSRLFRTTGSPIIAILICLYTNAATAQQPPKDATPTPELTPKPLPSPRASGNQISLNGRTLPGTWLQRGQTGEQLTTHISDGALRQLIGVDFLNSNNPASQPVGWFSSLTKPLVLATQLLGGYRYLDITNFAQTAGWQMQVSGNILVIATPKAQVTNIIESQTTVAPSQEARLVIDLDRPTPWQVKQELPVKTPQTSTSTNPTPPNKEWTITLDGIANPALVQRYTPLPTAPPPTSLPNLLKQLLPVPTPEPLIKQVEVVFAWVFPLVCLPKLAPQLTPVASLSRLDLMRWYNGILPGHQDCAGGSNGSN